MAVTVATLNKPLTQRFTHFMASGWGLALTGGVTGLLASLLQYAGNPANMGLCIAGFIRDIAGALGLHRQAAVQYIRPEIIGLVLGATLAALIFGEFRGRAGAAFPVYFILGGFAMIGALVFQGCSLRALLRLAGGDLNALLGLAGFAAGVWVGVQFLKGGFSLGRAMPSPRLVAWILPVGLVGLLALLILRPRFSDGGPIFFSMVGPGSLHAAIGISLAAGLVIGFLAQRSRFCTVGAVRDIIVMRNTTLMTGVIAVLGGAFLTNLLLGQVHWGFADQPVAQPQHLWNFLGMLLVGLASALAGGCPTRQLFLAGEGDGNSGAFLIGMLSAGAFAHNFNLVKPCVSGVLEVTVLPGGMAAVLAGLAVCLLVGYKMREA